jgi:cysteine desulfurase/selenocysteine lyase
MKSSFPIFKNNSELVYLDSAASTQKPQVVIDAIDSFYSNDYANIHRGMYPLSIAATQKYDEARQTVAEFIGAEKNEIIFTKGTTESINLLANTISSITDKKKIVLSEMEHHANIVPWQEAGFEIAWIPITADFEFDYVKAEELIDDKTALVSITHISNVLGTQNNIQKIIALARKNGALVAIDAAQSIAHTAIDVKELDCDFLAFSGHKMYGPTGVGILYGKQALLEKMTPYQFGGDMIANVTKEKSTWNQVPQKFEAGTPNIAGAIGLQAAIEFIQMHADFIAQEKEVVSYMHEQIKTIPNISIIGTRNPLSFTIKGLHTADLATLLGEKGICIRAGHHCCMPLMKELGVAGTARLSVGIYTTKEDIDKAITAIKEIQTKYGAQ